MPGLGPGIHEDVRTGRGSGFVDAHGSSPWAEGPRAEPGHKRHFLFCSAMRMSTQLTIAGLAGIPLVQPGFDLARLALDGYGASGLEPQDGDVLVVAQKIV